MMIERWIIIDNKSGIPETEGYMTEKDAWAAQVKLAREQNRSPYEWTAYQVNFEVR